MKKDKLINKIDPRFLKGIAHRGLHNEKFTENGLKAFNNAIKHDLAIELDIHLTKDNLLVVCHDDDLLRTTGKQGQIEKLTYQEICDNYKLLDGGKVPLLEEVLSLINERVPLVIELKVVDLNYKSLAKVFNEFIKNKIKDKSKYMFISFDPRVLARVRKHKVITSLLVWSKKKWTMLFRPLFNSIDIDQLLVNDKTVRRYQKHHFVNVWTIRNKDELNSIKGKIDTITFENIDYKEVQEALK
ncbi:MAG: glycerophosphodiester phosphodiesterase [Bacilli bacterium]